MATGALVMSVCSLRPHLDERIVEGEAPQQITRRLQQIRTPYSANDAIQHVTMCPHHPTTPPITTRGPCSRACALSFVIDPLVTQFQGSAHLWHEPMCISMMATMRRIPSRAICSLLDSSRDRIARMPQHVLSASTFEMLSCIKAWGDIQASWACSVSRNGVLASLSGPKHESGGKPQSYHVLPP